MAEKLDMKSMDITQENIKKIQALFPDAVTEVKKDGEVKLAIDFDVLKQDLSDTLIEDKQERYQMTWPEKSKAKVLANSRISATLRPDKEKSVNFDNTQNLYIEGDNLDVLKLLRETYLGKVKMIYIDPPYNTGNDFVYEDDFAQSAEEYSKISGDYDVQGNRLVKNADTNGRFHTDWLNMMYPRLKVARDLLTEDGAIFISLDDHELHNLLKCCDELFGSKNRIGLMTLLSNPRGSQNSKFLSNIHEYILMIAKDASKLELKGIAKSAESLNEFSEVDENGRRYRLLGLRKRGGAWKKEDRPNMFFPVYVNPTTGHCSLSKDDQHFIEIIPKRPTGELSRWTWGKERFLKDINSIIGKKINRAGENDSWDVFRKDYIDNENGEEKTTKLKTIWVEKEINYQNAKVEIKELFGNSEMFDFPKPTYIVHRLASMMDMEEDIIVDFFSGSATTAHAVMQLNAEDGGNRKFIMVQLPEVCDEKSEAAKAGYKTICEIGEERIRRAGKKIKEDNTRAEIYIDSIATIIGNEDVKTPLELLAYDVREKYLENANDPTVQYDYVLEKIIEAINDTIRLDDFEKPYVKFENELLQPTSRLADLLTGLTYGVDIGFRVLKLDSSNMQDVYYNPSEMTQTLLDATVDNVKPDRTPMDLLFQVMLDLGVELSAKIEEKTVAGKTFYAVNGNDLVACFDDNLTNEVITEIAKLQPLYAAFKDKSFSTDSVGINNEQIFKTFSPATVVKVM